jgi:hypothetical protein
MNFLQSLRRTVSGNGSQRATNPRPSGIPSRATNDATEPVESEEDPRVASPEPTSLNPDAIVISEQYRGVRVLPTTSVEAMKEFAKDNTMLLYTYMYKRLRKAIYDNLSVVPLFLLAEGNAGAFFKDENTKRLL